MSEEEKNKPHLVIKDGLLSVAIWKNENEEGKTYYTTTLRRIYKGDEGWKDAKNLNESDTLKAANLLMIAYNNILCEKDN